MSTMQPERKKKVDISSKVDGKVDDGTIKFYVGDRHIGTMSEMEGSPQYSFADGYGLENGKIYQIQVDGVQNDQYVEGCDMGWC